jgi:20S proteasome alpha/beta subunit
MVGIICKDAIMVASDGQISQTTSATAKRLDAEKIAAVRFGDGREILVAQSGSAVIGSRLIELIRDEGGSLSITGHRTPVICAENAIKKLKADILEPFARGNHKIEEKQEFFNSYDCSLLLAYYFNQNEPHLYSVDFGVGIAGNEIKYALLGCGSNVAESYMSWFPFLEMSFAQAAITAAFIVGEVKKADAFCGGPTHIKRIKLGESKVTGFSPEIMRVIENEVAVGAQKYKSAWGDSARQMAEEIIRKLKPEAK